MRQGLSSDRGQDTVEWAGVLIVVALVIGALLSTGIPGSIASGIQCQVSKVFGASVGCANQPGQSNARSSATRLPRTARAPTPVRADVEHHVNCGPGYVNKGMADCVRARSNPRPSNAQLVRALETVFSYFNLAGPADGVTFEVERTKNGFLVREPGTTGDAQTIRYGRDARGPYLRYYNKHGQPLDPRTGKPPGNVSKQRFNQLTHIRHGYQGPYKGLPPWYTGR